MIGDNDRQSIETVGGIVASLGDHPEHAVGQVYIGESRHKQMADIAYVWVDIIYRFCRTSGRRSVACTQHKCKRR